LLAVLVVVGLAVVVLSGGEEADDAVAAGEILLEPVHDPGPDPFSPDHSVAEPADPLPLPTAVVTAGARVDATAVAGLAAGQPGLYGGTRDNASCDAEQLVTFLAEHPDRAAAWAEVAGIRSEAIPDHIRDLTSVVLRADTRVTNHGFRDGHATPRQSVLQTGTAVLVDTYGIPQVRCACGNPLLPPQAVATGVRYTGTPWPAFAATAIVNIANVHDTVIERFVLIDSPTADAFTRRPGSPPEGPRDELVLIDRACDLYPELCRPPGLPPIPEDPQATTREGEPELQTGQVQITLRWSSTADLDLAVTDPAGDTVSYRNPVIASGGELDVDANPDCSAATTTPVENVVWRADAPDGRYTITVTYYTDCTGGSGPQAFELLALVDGQTVSLESRVGEAGTTDHPDDAVVRLARLTSGPADRGEVVPSALAPTTTGTLSAPGAEATYQLIKDPVAPTARIPGPVRNLSATATTNGREIQVSWTPPEVVGPGIDRFIVRVGGVETHTGGGQTSITLPFVEPGRTYSVTVRAANRNGHGPSETIDVTVPADATLAPPVVPRTRDAIDAYCEQCLREWRERGGGVMYDAFCGLSCALDAEPPD
jgi:hypothetical protein